jgi:hypothetical protein
VIASATKNTIVAPMITMAAALLSVSSTFGFCLTAHMSGYTVRAANEVLPLWTGIFASSFLAIMCLAPSGFFVRLSQPETLGSARPDVTPLTSQ